MDSFLFKEKISQHLGFTITSCSTFGYTFLRLIVFRLLEKSKTHPWKASDLVGFMFELFLVSHYDRWALLRFKRRTGRSEVGFPASRHPFPRKVCIFVFRKLCKTWLWFRFDNLNKTWTWNGENWNYEAKELVLPNKNVVKNVSFVSLWTLEILLFQ